MNRPVSISEKRNHLEQKKARLKDQEAQLKLQERKDRTRRLIECGGLVVKAELDQLPPDTLLGALTSLQQQMSQSPEIIEDWKQAGMEIFKAQNANKTRIIVTFATKPSTDLRQTIRTLGLKWNPSRREWHGLVVLELLKDTLKREKVKIQPAE